MKINYFIILSNIVIIQLTQLIGDCVFCDGTSAFTDCFVAEKGYFGRFKLVTGYQFKKRRRAFFLN
jgi:hypothetical protein